MSHNRLVYAAVSVNSTSSVAYNDKGLYLVLTTCAEWVHGSPFPCHTSKDPGKLKVHYLLSLLKKHEILHL